MDQDLSEVLRTILESQMHTLHSELQKHDLQVSYSMKALKVAISERYFLYQIYLRIEKL